MSSYYVTARHNESKAIVQVFAEDDHFGRHKYGYHVPAHLVAPNHETPDDAGMVVIGHKKFDKLFTPLETAMELNQHNVAGGIESFEDNKASNQVEFEAGVVLNEPEHDEDPTTRTFLLTDSCMWEAQRKNGTFYPHAIEVVDVETGQVRYIQSGARIKFVDGLISEGRDQTSYNNSHNDT